MNVVFAPAEQLIFERKDTKLNCFNLNTKIRRHEEKHERCVCKDAKNLKVYFPFLESHLYILLLDGC